MTNTHLQTNEIKRLNERAKELREYLGIKDIRRYTNRLLTDESIESIGAKSLARKKNIQRTDEILKARNKFPPLDTPSPLGL